MSDDVLVAIEGMLPRIDSALEGRRLGSSVERAAERLAPARRQTERFEAFATAAFMLGLRDDREGAASLGEAVQAAQHLAASMTEAQTIVQLAGLEDAFRDFTIALTALENVVRTRWRRAIETEFLPFVAIAQVLSRIPDLAALSAALSGFGREAREAMERRAGAETIVAEIARLRATRDSLDAELQSITGDVEIDGFLKAVTANTATLAIVSPAVLAWLSAHGALTAFWVGAGRS